MTHQSLYRKYRPQSFDDVVGQKHVTRTLRNAVAEGAVAHAYLFTGPRGTGKTTTARILAKALECEKGPTPDPDNTCGQCTDVAEGRHPDVHELDAASRTQVDNVREEIIGRLAYAPTRGRWKVYIIDEVHMLSTHSFNALLKSIEEPPSYTLFVLCTTHPHKVPETIHSRCQRFDFRRIGADELVEHLEHVASEEGMDVAEGAFALVAKHAGGSMRDAISTLEQLATFTGGEISLGDVESLLGEVDSALLFEVADLIAARDVAGSFHFVARLSASGVDIPEFVRELVGHIRDLYVTATVGDLAGIVEMTSDELTQSARQAAAFGPDRLARVLDVLGDLTGEIRWSPDPRLALEVALTRLARPQGELTLEALAERVAALETGVALVAPQAPQAPPVGESAPREFAACTPEDPALEAPERSASDSSESAATRRPDAAEPSVEVMEPATVSGRLDRAHVKRSWPAVVAEIRKHKTARGGIFDGTEADVDTDGETLVVEFPADAKFPMKQAASPETVDVVRRALATVLGGAPPFRYQLGRGPVRSPEPSSEPSSSHIEVPPADGGEETSPDIEAEPSVGSVGEEDDVADGDEIERLLVEGLGAEMISEQPHQPERKD